MIARLDREEDAPRGVDPVRTLRLAEVVERLLDRGVVRGDPRLEERERRERRAPELHLDADAEGLRLVELPAPVLGLGLLEPLDALLDRGEAGLVERLKVLAGRVPEGERQDETGQDLAPHDGIVAC